MPSVSCDIQFAAQVGCQEVKSTESLLGSVFSTARHLVLTAVLPGTLLLGCVAAIVASCGFTAAPSLSILGGRVADLSNRDLGLAALAGTIVGVLLRPVQFPFTQFLEGYWGSGRFGVSAAAVLRRRAVLRMARLGKQAQVVKPWVELPEVADAVRVFDPFRLLELKLESIAVFESHESPRSTGGWERRVESEEANRLLSRLPVKPTRIMPTRLGNALRAGEDAAGAPYELEIVHLSGHLHAVAPAEHVAGVEGPRTQLDVSVTLCAVFLIVAAVSVCAYYDNGVWMATTLFAFLLAWVSYQGAVSAAFDYTAALGVLIDLNRFRLYDALRIRPPEDMSDEVRRVAPVVTLVVGRRTTADGLKYEARAPS